MTDFRRKVYFIGMPRSASTSLCMAMKMLGYRVIHNPQSFTACALHDCAADIFTALNFRSLSTAFPDAHFILNLRSMEDWIESITAQSFWLKDGKEGFLDQDFPATWGDDPITMFAWYCQLYRTVTGDPTELRKAWVNHTNAVRKWFASKNDLSYHELNLKHGLDWESICKITGDPVPEEPFPYLNKGCIGDDVRHGL